VQCNTALEEWLARSNHIPVTMVLNAAPETSTDAPRTNYRAVDWEAVRQELSGFKPSSILSDPGRGQPMLLGPLLWNIMASD